MGFFGIFCKPTKPDQVKSQQVEGMIQQLAPEVFPMGYRQVVSESAELAKLLGCQLPQKEIIDIYTRSKALISIAKERTSTRCVPSIYRKANGRLSLNQAEAVFDFACGHLGFNYSKSLTSYRQITDTLFKTKITVDNEGGPQAVRGSFSAKSREVTLPEQNCLPYFVTYGSVLSAILSAEYVELRRRLEDCVLNMMLNEGLSQSEYSDGNFSFSTQLVHDAVGNRFLDYQVWGEMFQHMLTMFPSAAHPTIEKLRDSIKNSIKLLAQRNSLSLFPADNFIENPKKLGSEVAWVLAIYAHEVKSRHL